LHIGNSSRFESFLTTIHSLELPDKASNPLSYLVSFFFAIEGYHLEEVTMVTLIVLDAGLL